MPEFRMPERKTNEQGEERRVGFELEFAGLEMPEVAKILAETLGGQVHAETHAECKVKVDGVGDFVVELDWHFAKETAKERAQQHEASSEGAVPDDPFMEWLTRVASQVVPVEVVCPPIKISELNVLNKPVEQLREAGALGTEESLVYAFGVHINPEIPDLTANTLVSYLKAYCVCQSWLVKVHEVDPARRLTPYIDLYPSKYLQRVVSYEDVSMQDVIADYLEFNPTRNRALDLTPLIKFIDAEHLESKIQDPRINSRPTFHYRMPNCAIENPEWSLARSWRYWCVIEYLANEPELLTSLCQELNVWEDKLIKVEQEPWHRNLNDIAASLG